MKNKNSGFIPIIIAIIVVVIAVIGIGATYTLTKQKDSDQEAISSDIDEYSDEQATTTNSEQPDTEPESQPTANNQVSLNNTPYTPPVQVHTTNTSEATSENPPKEEPELAQKELEDFDLSCRADDNSITEGDTIEISLDIEGEDSDYTIEWDDEYLVVGGNTTTGIFKITKLGQTDIWVSVTRKSDALTKSISCEITVNEYIEPVEPVDVDITVSPGSISTSEIIFEEKYEDNDRDGVFVLAFNIDTTGNSDVLIEQLAVNFGVSGFSNLNEVAKKGALYGRDLLSSQAISSYNTSNTVVFDGVDTVLKPNTSKRFRIELDFLAYNTGWQDGYTISPLINSTAINSWIMKDKNGDIIDNKNISVTVASGSIRLTLPTSQ